MMDGITSERWFCILAEQSLYFDDCLEDVVANYSDMVFRLAVSQVKNRADADDVFQEVFLRYIRKKQSFESEEHRKAWFIRVTLNCCKNVFNSAWMKRTTPLQDYFAFEMEEESALFYELQKLPMKYRAVIHLFYYEEMSIDEICDALGKKQSAIKMRLSRARKMLKDSLTEDYHV